MVVRLLYYREANSLGVLAVTRKPRTHSLVPRSLPPRSPRILTRRRGQCFLSNRLRQSPATDTAEPLGTADEARYCRPPCAAASSGHPSHHRPHFGEEVRVAALAPRGLARACRSA